MTPTEALASIPAEEPKPARRPSPVERLRLAERETMLALNDLTRGSDAHDYADVAIDHLRDAVKAIEADEDAEIPGTEEAHRRGCTCHARMVHATDIDPPEVRRDRNCPLHGIDPDRAREDWLDRRSA